MIKIQFCNAGKILFSMGDRGKEALIVEKFNKRQIKLDALLRIGEERYPVNAIRAMVLLDTDVARDEDSADIPYDDVDTALYSIGDHPKYHTLGVRLFVEMVKKRIGRIPVGPIFTRYVEDLSNLPVRDVAGLIEIQANFCCTSVTGG